MKTLKAIPFYVFKNPLGDCTNHGVSSKYETLFIVCPRGCWEIDELDDRLMKPVKRHLFGRDVYHIEPYAAPDHLGWMAGGNFGHSSDSRFSELFDGAYGAISIHDRQETQEAYDLLTR